MYDWDDPNGSANLDLGACLIQASGVVNASATSFLLDLGRSGVNGSLTGLSAQAMKTTVIYVSGRATCGDITIRNVADIAMGGISTAATTGDGNYQSPGGITIGSASNRAGPVRVNYLHTYGAGAGPPCRPITIYSSDDVRIVDASTNAGDIAAYGSGGGVSSTIGIYHEGSFKARNIDDYPGAGWTGGERLGSFTARGDMASNGASGTFKVGRILQYYIYWEYKQNTGLINISGYTSVGINGDGTGRTIDSHSTATGSAAARYAGNMTIEDIQGANGLDPAYNGVLKLASNAGTVTLASLDLAKVRTAILRSGSGKSMITGDLLGFDVNNSTNGVLDAVTGQAIFYRRRPATNAYLCGATYPLKSGGWLCSLDFGTVVVLKWRPWCHRRNRTRRQSDLSR